MGLIKTAIMTGGVMYAANKIAKTVQERNNNDSRGASRDNSYPQQENYGPRPGPPQGPQRPRAFRDETYGELSADRDQHDYYAYDYDSNRDYSARTGMKPAKSSGFAFPASDDDSYPGRYIQPAEYVNHPAYTMTQQCDEPPSYSPHSQYMQPRAYKVQQRQQGQRVGEQQQQQLPRGSSSLTDVAAGMALDFMRAGGKDGKKDKVKKGSDMISELLK